MTHEQKMEAAIKGAPIPDALRKELPDPKVLVASIVILGGVLAGIAATGYGAVAEALTVGLLALGAFMSGAQIGGGLVELAAFFDGTRCDKAQSASDIAAAGAHFAAGVSKVGVGGLNLILTFAGAKAAGSAKTASELDSMMAKAPAATSEIDAKAAQVADQFGGRLATAEPKSYESALRKINAEYGGDASEIKDLARNTIVVKDEATVQQVLSSLRAGGAGIKMTSAGTNPLGYSGGAAYLETEAGITGEIQVNTPEMIYGKGPPEYAKSVLGSDQYDAIAQKSGQPSGLGHQYYEEYRSLDEGSPRAAALEAQSKAYYDAVRGR